MFTMVVRAQNKLFAPEALFICRTATSKVLTDRLDFASEKVVIYFPGGVHYTYKILSYALKFEGQMYFDARSIDSLCCFLYASH
jgi:hypothetical protein